MKKRISGISLIIALLMVVPTFTVGANGDPEESLVVVKEVFDGDGWVDWIKAEIDDIVQFRITITYYNVTDPENPHYAKNIVVNDTLPPCLEYVEGSAQVGGQPEEPEISNNYLVWDLGDTILEDGESYIITFNASVVDYGENVNEVNVTAKEHCTDKTLYGEDDATVIVEEEPCEPELEVIKKVWNGTDWADEIDGLSIGDVVTFQITITYYDCEPGETIVCLEVTDYLPCCLDFANNVNYEGSNFEFPEIEPVVDGKTIYWNWTGTDTIQMNDGDQMVITFDAEFVQYCDEDEYYNAVGVHAWTCCEDFFGRDSVLVDCSPPDTTFEKKVLDGEEWVDEIETYLGATLRFKLELTYYGNEFLTALKFVDILPCILEYADALEVNANITLEISEDGKTLWFNASPDVELHDGETITIEFDVFVNGTTGDCCECEFVINYAYVEGQMGCGPEAPYFFMEDEVVIKALANCPPDTPDVEGPTTGEVGDELSYQTVIHDPDGDQVYYKFNWGDSETDWLGPVDSDDPITEAYSWDVPGTYLVKVKAKDSHGAESSWTDFPLEVVITEPEEPELKICIKIKRFGWGRVSADIKNVGDEDVSDVGWTITVKGSVLKRVNVAVNCTIATLEKDSKKTVCTPFRSILRRFGRITVNVTAWVGEETFTEEADGFVLGRIILVRPLIRLGQ